MNNMESSCRICLREGATTPIFEDSESEDDLNSAVLAKLTLCLNHKLEYMAGYPRYICGYCLETLNVAFDFISKYKETCKILQERLVVKQENIEYDEVVYLELNTLDEDDYVIPEDNTLDDFLYSKGNKLETFEPKPKKVKIEFEDGACFMKKIKPVCELRTTEKKNKINIPPEIDLKKGTDVILKNEQLCKLKSNEKKKINNVETHVFKDMAHLSANTRAVCKLNTAEKIKTVQKEADKKSLETQLKKETRGNPVKLKYTNYFYKSNRIASSLLEGVFVWNGEDWCPTTESSKNALIEELDNKNPHAKKDERDQQHLPEPNKKRPPDPVLCQTCGKTFLNQEKYKRHKESNKYVQCSVCSVKISLSTLKRHMKRLHTSKNDFICNVCGKGFAFYGELKQHIQRVHDKSLPKRVTRRLPCELCGKDFITKKLLLIHGRSAHTGERPAKCTVCDASFFHDDYLREHMRLHTGECPFECPVCGRGYPHLGNMKSHMRNHRLSELSQETLSKINPLWIKHLRQ